MNLKNVFFKIGLILLPLTLSFMSCENFLKGGDIKTKLEEEMEWAAEKNPVTVIRTQPDYTSSGVYSDSIIEIAFSKSINPSSFVYEIKDGENNLESEYNEPEFYKNNTVVKIRPKENSLNLAVGIAKDISVTVSKSLKAEDGSAFSRNDYNFTFRINHNKDSIPPVVQDISLYKFNNIEKLADFDTDNFDLSDFDKNDMREEAYYEQNHVNSIMIHIAARDSGCGLKYARVTEELLYDSEGVKPLFTVDTCTEKQELTVVADENDPELYKGEGLYNFAIHADGIIKLTIEALDANENLSAEKKIYYVVKDTVFDLQIAEGYTTYYPIIYTNTFSSYQDDYGMTWDDNEYVYKLDINKKLDFSSGKIKFTSLMYKKWFVDFETDILSDYTFYAQTGNSYENLSSPVKLNCKIYDKDGEPVTSEILESKKESLSDYDYRKFIRGITFETGDIKFSDTSEDMFVVINVYDSAGNKYDIKGVIPKKAVYYTNGIITSSQESDNYPYGVGQRIFYLPKTEDSNPDEDIYYSVSDMSIGDFYVPEDEIYYVYYQTYYNCSSPYYNYYVYGPISERYELTGTNTEVTDVPEAPKVDYELKNIGNKWYVTATLDSSYDPATFDVYYLEKDYYNYIFVKDKDGKYSVTVEIDCSKGKVGTIYTIKTYGKTNRTEVYAEKNYTVTVTEDMNKTAPSISMYTGNGVELSYISAAFGGINFRVDNDENAETSFTSENKTYKEYILETQSYKYFLHFYENDFNLPIYGYRSTNVNGAQMKNYLLRKYYNFNVYYAKDKEIEDSDIINGKVNTYSGNSIFGIPSYLFDEGNFYIRVETPNTNGVSDISNNILLNISRKKGIKSKISIEGINKTSVTIPAKISTTGVAKTITYQPFELFFYDENNKQVNPTKYGAIQKFNEEYGVWIGGAGDGSGDLFDTHFIEYKNTYSINGIVDYSKSNYYVNQYVYDNCFVKIAPSNKSGNEYYAPTYLYLDNLAGEPKYSGKGNIKNLTYGTKMLTLFCDAPVFIHTLYADHDLGDDVDEWELRGVSLNDSVYYESQNIDVDLTHVPKNHYYVTVAWFADGTCEMTTVKQKK